MSAAVDIRVLLDVIARHPVLPPPGDIPPDSEELRSALTEIALGSRSAHALLIRDVAAAYRVGFDELVRRAGFVLACLALPACGTHYELLSVSPTASGREIRKRWAALIQLHHPDRAGPGGSLDDQARRLIEAYQTLRDPGRRRQYDAELARGRGDWPVVVPVEAPGSWRRLAPSGRWRWAPAVIVVMGAIVVLARWTSHPPTTPARPVPRRAPPTNAVETPASGQASRPEPRPPRVTNLPVVASAAELAPAASMIPTPRLPSLLDRLVSLEPGRVAVATAERAEQLVSEDAGEERLELIATPEAKHPDAAWLGERLPDRERGSVPWTPRTEEAASAAPVTTPPAPEAVSPLSTEASLPVPAEPAKPGSEEWRALIETFRSAYERKDLDALMKLFGADPRERETVGRPAVERLYAANFRALDGIRYDVSRVTAQPASQYGEIVVQARFRIRATHVENDSRPFDASGPVRWVIRREGDSLRIVGIDYDVSGR